MGRQSGEEPIKRRAMLVVEVEIDMAREAEIKYEEIQLVCSTLQGGISVRQVGEIKAWEIVDLPKGEEHGSEG